MNALFSFIVPIYNAKAFLFQCLNSIFLQTFDDYEVIMVDDGSTDGSGDIAKSFSAQDYRFRYFSQANQGTSGATNTALSLAGGEYVINLDDDDYVDPSLLEEAKAIIKREHPDIIQFLCVGIDARGQETGRQNFYDTDLVFTGHDKLGICEEIMPGAFNRTHSRKVIRKEVIGNNCFFGNAKGADTSFLRRVFLSCETVALSPLHLFFVRELATSESRKPNPPYLYKEWLCRELKDIDYCIEANRILQRSLPLWEFSDILDMYSMFAAKAYNENAFDKEFFRYMGKELWKRRVVLFDKGLRSRIKAMMWLRRTYFMAKKLAPSLPRGDFIV